MRIEPTVPAAEGVLKRKTAELDSNKLAMFQGVVVDVCRE